MGLYIISPNKKIIINIIIIIIIGRYDGSNYLEVLIGIWRGLKHDSNVVTWSQTPNWRLGDKSYLIISVVSINISNNVKTVLIAVKKKKWGGRLSLFSIYGQLKIRDRALILMFLQCKNRNVSAAVYGFILVIKSLNSAPLPTLFPALSSRILLKKRCFQDKAYETVSNYLDFKLLCNPLVQQRFEVDSILVPQQQPIIPAGH